MKVAIADEQSHIRAALRLLISEETDHSVISEIVCADDLLPKLIVTPVDVLIVDWSFLASDTKSIFKAIRDNAGIKHIVVISSRHMIRDIAVQAGADGFLSKSDTPESILNVLARLNGNNDAEV